MICFLSFLNVIIESSYMYVSFGLCTDVRKLVRGHRVGAFKGGERELSGTQC